MTNFINVSVVIRAVIIPAIIIGSLAGANSASAQEPRKPITVYTGDATAMQPGGKADQLVQRAQAEGVIQVIAGLRITMEMEHRLTKEQVAAQRAVMGRLQNEVAARVLGSANAPGQVRFDFIPYMGMLVTANQLRRLLADPQVVSVEEDVPVRRNLGDSTGLTHADDVWAKGFNGTNQVIAVLDDGVAKTHPMFAGGKVVSEACYSNTIANPNFASLCPGGVTESTEPGSGVNCPGCAHGTHVAGIAAGNSSILDGMARDSKLIAIQVFSRDTVTNETIALRSDQIKALRRVLALRDTYNIAAVNMSIGEGKFSGPCDDVSPSLTTAITNLRNAGIATIIASGNDSYTGFMNLPACISTAIAVGNSTKKDLVADDSNHSGRIKFMAPGSNIKSAVPATTYAVHSGTSQAAPHVAGAFALLRNAKPTATINEILEALTCSGKTIDQRFVTGGDPVEVTPRLRIDLLGAYNHLRLPTTASRTWLFTTADDIMDWAPFRGQWRHDASLGTYTVTPITSGSIVNWVGSQVANCNTALQIIARMRVVNPCTDGCRLTGIFFKTTTDFTKETVSGYFAAWMVANSVQELMRFTDYNFATGVGTIVSLCRHSHNESDEFNTIRVVSNGSKHSFYLNNTLVCTATDATYTTGDVMLAAMFPPDNVVGRRLDVDSVTIRALSAGAASDDVDPAMDPASFEPVAEPTN
jgi:subtilisin family serine protease